MKRIPLVLLAFAALALFLFPLVAASPPTPAPTVLPIEVFSPAEATVVSTSIAVPNAAGIDRMFLRINNAGYIRSRVAEAEVRVNGGPWIPLDNDTVECAPPADKLGCISGIFTTVDITFPVSGVRSGTNTIDFRYNGTDGITRGYTVLAANFRKNGVDVLPASSFQWVDPYLAVLPSTDPAVIARGEEILNTAQLIDSPLNPVPIRAKCVDCHMRDGKDLKYFRNSVLRIVVSSMHHGLSEADGDAVAAKIYSLQRPTIADPWRELFQPGPGLDSGSVIDWVRGSGTIPSSDLETAPALLAEYARMGESLAYGDLNMREFPTAMAMPDWARWLPTISPCDANPDCENSKYEQGWRKLLALDDAPTPPTTNERVRAFEAWLKNADFGITITNDKTDAYGCEATISARRFKGVRALDYLLEHPEMLEAAKIYPRIEGDNRQHGEFRGWPGIVSALFGATPHRTCSNDWSYAFLTENNVLESARWYRLALIQNPGYHHASEQNNIDFKYFLAHNANVQDRGLPQTVYSLATWLKGFQQSNKDLCGEYEFDTKYPAAGPVGRTKVNIGQCPFGPAADADYAMGLQWRAFGPAGILGNADVSSAGLYVERPGYPDRDLYRRLVEPIAAAWIGVIGQHDPDEWPRGNGDLVLESADAIAKPFTGSGYFMRGQTDATKVWRLLVLWTDLGLDWYTVLKPVADFSANAWPANDWYSIIGDEPGHPDPDPDPDPGTDPGQTCTAIELTAVGGGKYTVFSGGTAVSTHTAEREAVERLATRLLQGETGVYYTHDGYRVNGTCQQ